MHNNPFESPDNSGEMPVQPRGTLTRRVATFLVVVVVLFLLIGLLLPAMRTAREPARRVSCASNLRNIALALQEYESVYHALPPAYTVDAQGKPLHSWRTLILPYLDCKELYGKIDLSKPWDDPANEAAYKTRLPIYRCPSSADFGPNTPYLAVVGPHSCFLPTAPRKLSEITDGRDSTLMVVEVDAEHGVHWMAPVDTNAQWLLNPKADDKGNHPGLFQAAFVDGSVHTVSSDIAPETLRAMISIDGHDDDPAKE